MRFVCDVSYVISVKRVCPNINMCSLYMSSGEARSPFFFPQIKVKLFASFVFCKVVLSFCLRWVTLKNIAVV